MGASAPDNISAKTSVAGMCETIWGLDVYWNVVADVIVFLGKLQFLSPRGGQGMRSETPVQCSGCASGVVGAAGRWLSGPRGGAAEQHARVLNRTKDSYHMALVRFCWRRSNSEAGAQRQGLPGLKSS